MSKKIRIVLIIVILIAIGINIPLLFKNTIILYYGIRFYTRMKTFTITSGVVLIVGSIVSGVMGEVLSRRKVEYVSEYTFDTDGLLADSEKSKILSDLSNTLHKRWNNTKVAIRVAECVAAADEIDLYINSIKIVLKRSEVSEIEDCIIMLRKVEKGVYKNLNKLLNYLLAFNRNSEEYILTKVQECKQGNKQLLACANQFVEAVVEYVNSHMESDDHDAYLIEQYKNNVLQTLDEADIYLT